MSAFNTAVSILNNIDPHGHNDDASVASSSKLVKKPGGFLSQLLKDDDDDDDNHEWQESSTLVKLSDIDREECSMSAFNYLYEEDEDIGPDQNLANMLLSDENIYSSYINGEMSFDDLLHQMHWKSQDVPSMDNENSMHGVEELDFDSKEDKLPGTKFRSPRPKAVRKKTIPKAQRLPDELAKYLGLADVKLNAGDYEGASKICFDVIKAAPKSCEAYQVLSDVFCRQDKVETARNYLYIAAMLNPSDVDKWITLIDLAKETENYELSISYCKDALKFHRSSFTIRFELATLYEQQGYVKPSLLTYLTLLKLCPDSDSEQQFNIARTIADKFFKISDVSKAVESYEVVFHNYPDHGTDIDKNNVVDLMVLDKAYEKAVLFLVKHCHVKLFYNSGKLIPYEDLSNSLSSNIPLSRCDFPDNLPPDIIVKVIVVLINLDYSDLAKPHIDKYLLSLDVDVYGDWYYDVGEALLNKKLFTDARDILVKLKNSQEFGQARVWLALATCYNELEQLEDAVEAYQQVLTVCPSHTESCLTLSTLLHRLGRSEEAMATLARRELLDSGSDEDKRLDYQRCLMLDTPSQYESFVMEASKLLFSDLITYVDCDIASIFSYMSVMRKSFNMFKESLSNRINQKTSLSGTNNSVSSDDLWDLYLRLISRLHTVGDFDKLESCSFMARLLPQFTQDESRCEETEALNVSAALINRHGPAAYAIVKEWCRKYPDVTQCWNLFGLSITLSRDLRHNRYIIRELQKDIDILATNLINAHNSLVAGSYRYAVAYYTLIYTRHRDNPLLSLMLAVTFLNLACQKFITNRHTLVVQTAAFLNEYKKLRGNCQEVYFNIARAYHQLMLCHLAIPNYEKVLTMPAVGNTQEEQQICDLKREAAFNLMLMYRNSGNIKKAHHIMQQYLRV